MQEQPKTTETNESTERPEEPKLTLNVRRVRTQVRGGWGDISNGHSQISNSGGGASTTMMF